MLDVVQIVLIQWGRDKSIQSGRSERVSKYYSQAIITIIMIMIHNILE